MACQPIQILASSSRIVHGCQNGNRIGVCGAPTCFPRCKASLSLSLDEVVAEEEEEEEADGRNTFLTAANQPPPPPAACFFPMPACPRDGRWPGSPGDELLKSANLEAGRRGEEGGGSKWRRRDSANLTPTRACSACGAGGGIVVVLSACGPQVKGRSSVFF